MFVRLPQSFSPRLCRGPNQRNSMANFKRHVREHYPAGAVCPQSLSASPTVVPPRKNKNMFTMATSETS